MKNTQEIKKFNKWRKRTAKGMPSLAMRVFALRGKAYMGSGFHWSLEKRLGNILFYLNNFDRGYNDLGERIAIEVIVESLYREVAQIEKSLN